MFWFLFVLLPLLLLVLFAVHRPGWLPLVIPFSTLSALLFSRNEFCRYEWRPLLAFLLAVQMALAAGAVLLLGRLRRAPRYLSFSLDTLAALLFSAMCVAVPFQYLELEWRGRFFSASLPPSTALLLIIPFAAGVLLSLWGARKLRGPNK